jgi:nucleotide-binding universal stress UspA family protein/N-acetylglutamate synthase-like GNAT family acetyltransferase
VFKRVLVATDFSAHADRTLECIGEIPGMEEIILVHVIDQEEAGNASFLRPNQTSAAKIAADLMEKKKQYLEQATGIPVRAILETGTDGDKAGPILRLAQRIDVSLIVMGARGNGLILGRILGSVSEAVIRQGKIDVLVMHFRGMEDADPGNQEKFCRNVFSHVLCPVDFSKPSRKTVEYISRMKSVSRVTLLHVVGYNATKALRDLQVKEAEQKIREMATELRTPGINVNLLIRTGDPVGEICATSEEKDVSLIMLARFGESDYIKNIPLGGVAAGVISKATRPLFILSPHISLSVHAREMLPAEFPQAEELWLGYHQQKTDPVTDRIFGVFVEGTLAGVARCRRHPDGFEIDGVFVPEEFRESGYARKLMQVLIEKCGSTTLFMHGTLELVNFYSTFGFRTIDESALPQTIRDRFNFAEGDMKGLHVQPMKRDPSI